jgi:predicted 3-demethylubiquinone-9 3-methyltransferase (glyoxalase superfamily)
VEQKIIPFLWYDRDAEDAVAHYMAAFKDSRITAIERYGEAGPGPQGSVMIIEFTLAGQNYVALNGGPTFKPTEAFSLMVLCDDQAEIDRLWTHLSEGGSTSACGWLKDRWGYSWQITPRRLMEAMKDKDPVRKARVFAAMLTMTKIDVAAIEKAYAGS